MIIRQLCIGIDLFFPWELAPTITTGATVTRIFRKYVTATLSLSIEYQLHQMWNPWDESMG